MSGAITILAGRQLEGERPPSYSTKRALPMFLDSHNNPGARTKRYIQRKRIFSFLHMMPFDLSRVAAFNCPLHRFWTKPTLKS